MKREASDLKFCELWLIILKGSKECRKWSTAGAGGDLGGGGSVDLVFFFRRLSSSALNCKTPFDPVCTHLVVCETQKEMFAYKVIF